MTTSILIGTFAIAIGAFGANDDSKEERSFNASGLKSIEYKNGSGDVRIVGKGGEQATVVANKREFGDGCELVMDRKGDTLVVQLRSKSWFSTGRCEVDFDITAPSRIDVNAATGSGDIDVEGTTGRVDVRVGSGSVNVDGQVSNLTSRSGSGRINVRGLSGGADIRTGSGRIELTYREAPRSGEVSIRAGSGSATINMPASARVRTSFRAGSGRMRNELPSYPDADFRIEMRAGSGSLHIKPL